MPVERPIAKQKMGISEHVDSNEDVATLVSEKDEKPVLGGVDHDR